VGHDPDVPSPLEAVFAGHVCFSARGVVRRRVGDPDAEHPLQSILRAPPFGGLRVSPRSV